MILASLVGVVALSVGASGVIVAEIARRRRAGKSLVILRRPVKQH